MFYNRILKASHEFINGNHYCATKIFMNPNYYNNLEKEMFGGQWMFLIKCSKVLGLKIIINYEVQDFKLE